MTRPFLTAEWANLCLATYRVEPAFLKELIPPWLEPDLRDGSAFVSLVAFEFLNTKVLGVSWPGFRNFPEINLRAYVRHGDRRGVIFIREFVPQQLVAFLARSIYNEPYLATPITASISTRDEEIEARYELSFGGRHHSISVRGRMPGMIPAEDSGEHFFKEHRWGFGRSHSGAALSYEVEHPVWEIYPVQAVSVEFDWEVVYGSRWSFLKEAEPYSTAFARGSKIAVYPARSL